MSRYRFSTASTTSDFIEVVGRPKKIYRVRSSIASTTSQYRDKIVLNESEWIRILKNVAVLSIGFMVCFTPYQGTMNLQSSINAKDGLGTISLSTIYLTFAFSCVILPTLLIRKITTKWTILIGMLGYIPYIGLQLWSSFYTLIPAALLAGTGAGPLWTGMSTYLTQVSQVYSCVNEKAVDGIIVLFFGLFYFAWQLADLYGNLLSSLMLSAPPSIDKCSDSDTNKTFHHCGVYFCGGMDFPQPPREEVVLLFSIYVPCILAAALLIILFLDPLKRYGEGRKGSHAAKDLTMCQSICAAFHQMRRTNQQLLIPLTIFIGMEQAFLAGDFTQAFVGCILGVDKIGYVMVCYGVVNACCSLVFGLIMQYVGRPALILIGAALHFSLIYLKLTWEPEDQNHVIFYIMSGMWGAGDAVWQTQINGLYGLLFRRNKEAAFSNYRLFESTGFVVSYSYSSFLCLRVKLYVLFVNLALGCIGYIIVEIMYKRKQNQYRKEENLSRLAKEAAQKEREAANAAERAAAAAAARAAAHAASVAYDNLISKAEVSDGEDDDLEDDVVVTSYPQDESPRNTRFNRSASTNRNTQQKPFD